MPHYRIKLTDENGTYWMMDRDKLWHDDFEISRSFATEAEARHAALDAAARCSRNPEWFPKIEVISFR